MTKVSFADGNGRIGRLLIPLYLQSKKYLDNPCLYISYFFEKNRDLYYQKLNDVRVKNDIIGWIKFFLEGIIETTKIAKEKFKKVVELTKKVDTQISDLKVKYDNAKKIIDYFYDEPYSSRKKISEALKMPESTNVYLHYVLDIWIEKWVKPRAKGYVEIIRYADDLLMV